MILVDMNQISIASVMMHLHLTKAPKVVEKMVRHMILNSIRMYREMFFEKYGELVICYDSIHYCRRAYFPQYIKNSNITRDSSAHECDAIFRCLIRIKIE